MTTPTHDISKKLGDFAVLLEVAKAMSAERDLHRLMQLITNQSSQLLDAERSSLYLVDEASQELYTWIAENLEIKEVRTSIGKGLAGMTAKCRKMLNVPDAYADPNFNPAWDKRTGYRTRNVLCAPLLTHEGKIVGVIQVLNKRGSAFNDYDETLLAALASHAAVSIDNAQLMEHFIEKERMRQSLEIARDIQRHLLPREAPQISNFQIAGWTLPCDETGGDYYDFVPAGEGGLGIAVGDVSSHGIGPALLMTTARAFLRSLVRQGKDPAGVLGVMNDLLVRDMTDGRFMTMFYGVLRTADRVLEYSSAGHEPPLLVRPKEKSFEELKSAGCPLGILDGVEYPVAQQRIQPDEFLVLSTDGIQESMNEAHEKFGRQRVADIICANADADVAAIIRKVHEAVVAFCGGAPQRDDLTLVIVKCPR